MKLEKGVGVPAVNRQTNAIVFLPKAALELIGRTQFKPLRLEEFVNAETPSALAVWQKRFARWRPIANNKLAVLLYIST